MIKRLTALLIAIVLLFTFSSTSYACDETQTNDYVTRILFGERAYGKASDEKTKMLMAALYLCSEQADDLGQDKIDFLKSKKVASVPALKDINVKGAELYKSSHNYWEYEYPASKKTRANRKKVLRNTVNKVFDFGFVNNIFGSNKGKCDSFAAFLYYSHILADYLEDIPDDTAVKVGGVSIPIFGDEPSVKINGDIPNFTDSEINRASMGPFTDYSPLDGHERAGVVIACITPEKVATVGKRANMSNLRPSGWSFNKYPGIVNIQPPYLFNRCHLLAHGLGGEEIMRNVVTGTRYMNELMEKEVESKVLAYISNNKKSVLYRATPIYKGNNALCSGIQLEAYSIDDRGETLHFNRFFYNVQPGVVIDYSTGANHLYEEKDILPFAVLNPEKDHDLISEMNKHLEVLFEDQKKTGTYISMKNELNSIAHEARTALNSGKNDLDIQQKLIKCENEYYLVLCNYVPKLLEREEFFNKTFI